MMLAARLRRLALLGPALSMTLAGAASAQMVGPPRPGPRCLPGNYDGAQMEMAAGLQLGADHRFRYQLSYGALDEEAAGTWESDGAGSVLLTSDPTTPPRFALVEEALSADGKLDIRLDVPRGITPQYFGALVRFADGRSIARQFSDDGLTIELRPEDQLVSVALVLSVLDIESEAFKVASARGSAMRFRFEPNDLGKVAFEKAPLKIDQEDLLLERHERQIRFRRMDKSC
jgi:hypothetical protein